MAGGVEARGKTGERGHTAERIAGPALVVMDEPRIGGRAGLLRGVKEIGIQHPPPDPCGCVAGSCACAAPTRDRSGGALTMARYLIWTGLNYNTRIRLSTWIRAARIPGEGRMWPSTERSSACTADRAGCVLSPVGRSGC